uniref:G_PROTEIN_RECEP_F1_2 domain-containing protein n=1 Tax=Haemonchus contortus TaxID=6289 RepID=A0A7I4Y9I3_HAECO
MVVLTCSFLVAGILNLFNYRRHLVTPTHHFLKISDDGHIYTSIAITLIYFIACLAGIIDILPDQTEARDWAVQEYTCAKSAMSVPQLTVFTLSKVRRIVLTVGKREPVTEDKTDAATFSRLSLYTDSRSNNQYAHTYLTNSLHLRDI